MQVELLEILRCPFCGSAMDLPDPPRLKWAGSELESGILGCDCSAYPIVAGIPYLQVNQMTRAVLERIDQGQPQAAFQLLAGLDKAAPADGSRLPRGDNSCTFRQALSWFCTGPEADYFLYRNGDPTYVVGEGVSAALATAWPLAEGRVLDICCGTGHLARALHQLHGQAGIVVADRDFWKVWLARRYLAPQSVAVCCDAAQPLPFARGSFDWVICADGMNYIWPRRLLASEMRRVTKEEGLILVLHMHNASCENPSEGMPLKPRTFRGLFETGSVRLFGESKLLDSLLADRSLDLRRQWEDSDLLQEPAYCAVVSDREFVFKTYQSVPIPFRPDQLRFNPLYCSRQEGTVLELVRRFPSGFYESEYAAGKRYLPETVHLEMGELEGLKRGGMSEFMLALVEKRVLLDLPENYV